ncbi:hypothetical protein [Staphylococcus caprae]|uniref:hypothetical protein n=1 Tax=Staphylococcus caprae TaxID=29380 RepID=UPI003B219D8E
MNYLETTQHIKLQIVNLLTLSETAKYYALIHHNKFEETLNAFNQNVETEHQWVEDHKAILGTTPEFATYYEVIQQLHIHPLLTVTQGDILFYINTKQILLYKQLLKIDHQYQVTPHNISNKH